MGIGAVNAHTAALHVEILTYTAGVGKSGISEAP